MSTSERWAKKQVGVLARRFIERSEKGAMLARAGRWGEFDEMMRMRRAAFGQLQGALVEGTAQLSDQELAACLAAEEALIREIKAGQERLREENLRLKKQRLSLPAFRSQGSSAEGSRLVSRV